jgi:TetR/AcrR family transcriptional repressor of nem operon
MPRPRDFDSDDVMTGVTDVFTAHGYAGTSMSMLIERTGLGKQSLYNSFGDKQGLYLKALECAVSRMAPVQDAMRTAKTGFEALEVFFDAIFSGCLSDAPERNNCIISAGLLEGIDDADISGRLHTGWNATKDQLEKYVTAGQRDGSIRTDLEANEIAISLMTTMSGLRVTARVVENKKTLQNIVQNALSAFRAIREESKSKRFQESRP